MSFIGKCIEYSKANGGALASPEKVAEFAHEQMDEYMQKITKSVIPEYSDKFIIVAAYKLIYESLYNMLEPEEKEKCDWLVRTSEVISTEKVVVK